MYWSVWFSLHILQIFAKPKVLRLETNSSTWYQPTAAKRRGAARRWSFNHLLRSFFQKVFPEFGSVSSTCVISSSAGLSGGAAWKGCKHSRRAHKQPFGTCLDCVWVCVWCTSTHAQRVVLLQEVDVLWRRARDRRE